MTDPSTKPSNIQADEKNTHPSQKEIFNKEKEQTDYWDRITDDAASGYGARKKPAQEASSTVEEG